MSDALRERPPVTKQIVQSLSSTSGFRRPIGRALALPVSASVTSQQYRTRAIVFAAPATSRFPAGGQSVFNS
jgi:hypothetical protein